MSDQIGLSVGTTKATGNSDDVEYKAYLARMRTRFLDNAQKYGPYFVAETPELFPLWLEAFEEGERQFHNCSSCRHFVRAHGATVFVGEDGITVPALWNEDDAPELYKPAVRAMIKALTGAKILGPGYSKEQVWGDPETGPWVHMSVTLPPLMLHRHAVLTPNQLAAEKREDHGSLCRGLAEFSPEHVTQAVTLLQAETLYRSEKLLGMAQWLERLHAVRKATPNKLARENLTWLAVATAPPGFCHPRTSMIGTLLEDLASGMAHATVAKRFADKMHPLRYQRPQSAPSDGNIEQAEKLFEKLGLAAALRRRFARLEDLQTLWRPTPQVETQADGLFGHLRPNRDSKHAKTVVPQAQTITWEKFRRTVLPTAEQILCLPPAFGSYAAMVTASDPSAPPILQWDLEEKRNPVSWYLYPGGSPAAQWNVIAGRPVRVTAIVLQPNMWAGEEKFTHQGKGALFILEGAVEGRSNCLALFPETIRSELHAVRKTIEAFSRRGHLEDRELASACGLIIQAHSDRHPHRTKGLDGNVEVQTKGQRITYHIDRWD